MKIKILQPSIRYDFENGMLLGKKVKQYDKTYGQIKSIYQTDDSKISNEEEMYRVYSYLEDDTDNGLAWGVTVLNSILVGEECNMTRGHFHLDRTEPEIYIGSSGNGLLLLMNDRGECFAEEVFRHSVHYIKGEYAHRLINTGNQELKVAACWNLKAGHDYEEIEKHPFSVRVFKRQGQIVFENN